MCRWFGNFAGVLAVVGWIALVVLGIRSYWVHDSWGYERPVVPGEKRWGGNVSSATGTVEAEWWLRPDTGEAADRESHFAHSANWVKPDLAEARRDYARSLGGFQLCGVVLARREFDPRPGGAVGSSMPQVVRNVIVPHWMLALGGGIWPGVWWMGVRQRRLREYRKAHGLCVACGYDLRASEERCPECGRHFARTKGDGGAGTA